MNTFQIFGLTVDPSGIDSDGERWCGKVTFTRGDETAKAVWLGANGSDMGEMVDVEGDECLCFSIGLHSDRIESAISDTLGVPRESDGRAEMFAAIEEARQVHERRVGT